MDERAGPPSREGSHVAALAKVWRGVERDEHIRPPFCKGGYR